MKQSLLYLRGDVAQLAELGKRLEAEGFQVQRANRLAGGIEVRVRQGSEDEATVERVAASVAPGASRGYPSAATVDTPGYRDDRP